MPMELSDEALDFLLARSGLSPTATQRAELKSIYPHIAAMAEPALTYGFTKEDLA